MASLMPAMMEAFTKAVSAPQQVHAQSAANEVTSHRHADLDTLAEVASMIARPEAQHPHAESNLVLKNLLAELQVLPPHMAPLPVAAVQNSLSASELVVLQPSAGSAFRPLFAA